MFRGMKQKLALILVAVLVLMTAGCAHFFGRQSAQNPPPGASEAPGAPSRSKPFIDPESLDESERFYVNLAKSLYLTGFKKQGELTEQEKGAFFKWVISTDRYAEESASWWNPEQQAYEIPLSDIERILFTHLDAETLDPERAFNTPGAKEYDSQRQRLYRRMLGGYGGAAALEAL